MALVIDGASEESGFGEEDRGQLEEPAGFAGEAVDDGDEAEWWTVEWSPPLGEEFETVWVGEVGGGVGNGVAGVELGGGE